MSFVLASDKKSARFDLTDILSGTEFSDFNPKEADNFPATEDDYVSYITNDSQETFDVLVEKLSEERAIKQMKADYREERDDDMEFPIYIECDEDERSFYITLLDELTNSFFILNDSDDDEEEEEEQDEGKDEVEEGKGDEDDDTDEDEDEDNNRPRTNLDNQSSDDSESEEEQEPKKPGNTSSGKPPVNREGAGQRLSGQKALNQQPVSSSGLQPPKTTLPKTEKTAPRDDKNQVNTRKAKATQKPIKTPALFSSTGNNGGIEKFSDPNRPPLDEFYVGLKDGDIQRVVTISYVELANNNQV